MGPNRPRPIRQAPPANEIAVGARPALPTHTPKPRRLAELLAVSNVTCHGVCPPWLGVFDNPSSLFAMLIDGCHELPSVPGRAGLHGAGIPKLKLAHTTDEQPLAVGNRRSWPIMAQFHLTDLDGCWLTVATYCRSSHFCGEKAVELFLYRISAHWQSPNISKWRVSHRRHWSMQRVFSVCLALH